MMKKDLNSWVRYQSFWMARRNKMRARAKVSRQLRLENLENRCVLSTISGIVFNDANGDGIQNNAEPGLPGWTVFHETDGNAVLDPGDVPTSTVTDADGRYSITVADGPPANHYGSAILPVGDSTFRWLNTNDDYRYLYYDTPVDTVINFGFRQVPYAGFYPQGGESLVNETTTGQQGTALNGYFDANSVAADSAGNYAVAWVTPGTNSQNLEDQIYVRVFNADGSAKTGELLVATAQRKSDTPYSHYSPGMPVVAMSGDGSRLAVSWNSYGAATDTIAPFVRTYDVANSVWGSQVQVSPYSTKEHYGVTGIAMDGNGDFAVLMTGGTIGRFSNEGITQFQQFTSAGAATGKRTQVVDAGLINGKQGIAMDGAGNFVVVWQDSGIFAQMYKASGAKTGGRITVATDAPAAAGAIRAPAVAMNASGRFVVTWTSGYYSGSPVIVTAQVFDATGHPVAGNVPLGAGDSEESPGTAIDSDGNVTVAWSASAGYSSGAGPSNVSDVHVSRLSAGGVKSETYVVNTTTEGGQMQPSVAATGTGFVVAWNGRGVGDTDGGIFTQRYTTTPPPAAPAGATTLDAALVDVLLSQSDSTTSRKR